MAVDMEKQPAISLVETVQKSDTTIKSPQLKSSSVTLSSDHETSTIQTPSFRQTKRGLLSRHVQLMVIGGSIGTGFFVGIGGALSRAGPLSLLLGYLTYGLIFIWPLNLCVGEMVAYLPVKGTIFELASRFVDPAMAFSLGWLYFLGCVFCVCGEYSASAAIVGYWIEPERVSPAVWITLALVVSYAINIAAVHWYGETEFVVASTKLILLAGLILLTFVTMVGGNPRHDVYGFRYWGDGLAMREYYTTGHTGRFLGYWQAVRYAVLTISGPDLLALASGEIQNPRVTVPRCARLVFYRLVGFSIMGVLAVGILCSSRDPNLIGAIDSGATGAAASPFVIGIQNLGIDALPSLLNAAFLLASWSCANAWVYASSRTLYSLSCDGKAPQFLRKCNKKGVPYWPVTIVSCLSCITFLSASNGAVTVFYWFVSLTISAFILVYMGFIWVFLGWYYALKAQGISRHRSTTPLPYVAPFAPYWPYAAIILGVLLQLTIGFDGFAPFSVQSFVTNYFSPVFFVVLFCGYKFIKGTTYVRSKDADLVSGKKEIDEDCKEWEGDVVSFEPDAGINGGGHAIHEHERKRLARMSWFRRAWERCW